MTRDTKVSLLALLVGIVLIVAFSVYVPLHRPAKQQTSNMGIGDNVDRITRAIEQVARDTATVKRCACAEAAVSNRRVEGCQ